MKNNWQTEKHRIFARYRIPNRESLKKGIEYWVKEKGTNFNKELDFYIKGRIGDISDSLEIILREEQRIIKAKKCIKMSISLMTEGKNKQAESISFRYYNDLLSYIESDIKSRIK